MRVEWRCVRCNKKPLASNGIGTKFHIWDKSIPTTCGGLAFTVASMRPIMQRRPSIHLARSPVRYLLFRLSSESSNLEESVGGR